MSRVPPAPRPGHVTGGPFTPEQVVAGCACGHRLAQHYRDRKGRPMCVGTCGCAGYRPVTPAGAR